MIDIDLKEVNKLITKLKCTATRVQEAKQAAIRQVATETKDNWAKLIGQEINLPLSTIEEAIVAEASGDSLNIAVDRKRLPFYTSSIGGIPLYRFQPNPGSTGTSVLIKNLKGYRQVKHAFIGRTRSGHPAVMTRYSKSGSLLQGSGKRTPIRQLYSSSVTDIASNQVEKVQQAAVEQLTSAVTAELKKGC